MTAHPSGRERPGAPRVLVLTNMWPTDDAPLRGSFVHEQVDDLRRLAPIRTFDVLALDGRRGRRAYLQGLFELRKRLREGHGYDLVHAHYGLTGAVAAAQRRTPFIVTFHGSDVYIPWQRAVSRFAAARAAAAIFVSERLRLRLGAADGHVVPCGVDTDTFRPMDRGEARLRLGLEDDDAVVLFPGDPARVVKNHALFRATLDVLRPHRPVRALELVGIPHGEVPVYLNAADVVLLTSRYEGAGSVAKEALACDVPVVSVDVGDVAEMIDGVDGCAVAAKDPRELSAAVERALERGGRCEGRRRLAETRTDADAVARRVLAVHDEVLGRRTTVAV